MVNAVSKAGGNSYTAWGKVTPHHDALIARMISAQTHIIVTMRTKTAYELATNDKGKQVPTKVGMAPTQRDGVEYEFTIVFDIDQNHNFTCSKDRTSMFNSVDIPQPLDSNVGQKILAWLESGIEAAPVEAAPAPSVSLTLIENDVMSKFMIEASAIREEYKRGDENEACIGDAWINLVHDLNRSWYALCGRYCSEYPLFKVPEKWVEGMRKLLGDNELAGEAKC